MLAVCNVFTCCICEVADLALMIPWIHRQNCTESSHYPEALLSECMHKCVKADLQHVHGMTRSRHCLLPAYLVVTCAQPGRRFTVSGICLS